MKSQFSTELFSSFFLWFEAQLVSSSSKAYITNQDNVFDLITVDSTPTSHYTYQGKYRGIVPNYDIDQPNSGIFIDGSFITGSSPDVYIDYLNGRVILPTGSGASLNITANNTVKEIHVYKTEDDLEQLVIGSDFVDLSSPNSTYMSEQTDDRNKKTYMLPACFVRNVSQDGESFSFGGEDNTKNRIQVIVITKDDYLMDGVLSLFSDLRQTCIKHVPYGDYPYGVFNSIKNYPYIYSDFVSGYTTNSFIEDVNARKLDFQIAMNKMEKNICIGIMDFDLSTYRFPRA